MFEDLALMFPMLGALAGVFLIYAIISSLALYVYNALTWMVIAKKLKYKYPWLAWIPGANVILILQLGGFHWAWIFLLLVPILGWFALGVMGVIATWRVYEKRKYPGWLSLIFLLGLVPMLSWFASIGQLVIQGLVAWVDQKSRKSKR